MRHMEQFNEEAKQILTLAQEEAHREGQPYISTEGIVIALFRCPDCAGQRILTALGVDAEAFQERVAAAVDGPSFPSSRVKKLIEIAFDEARRMSHQSVGSEHLLLGVLREGDSRAAHTLAGLGITADAVDEAMSRMPPRG